MGEERRNSEARRSRFAASGWSIFSVAGIDRGWFFESVRAGSFLKHIYGGSRII
jgi:hypothetical protein